MCHCGRAAAMAACESLQEKQSQSGIVPGPDESISMPQFAQQTPLIHVMAFSNLSKGVNCPQPAFIK